MLEELQRLDLCFGYQSADFFSECVVLGLRQLEKCRQLALDLLDALRVYAGVRWDLVRPPRLDDFHHQTTHLG